MPTNNFELDANSATTALGPVNFLGQDLPSLGNNWSVETQFTVQFTGGWQHAGLIVWQADNNFFRSTITHSLSDDNDLRRAVQGQPDARTEGARVQAGGNITICCRTTRSRSRSGCATRAPTRPTPSAAQYRVDRAGQRRQRRLGQLPGANAAWNSSGDLQRRPAARAVTRRARGSASSPRATSRARPARTPYTGTPGTVAGRLLPGHPGSDHLRDRRPDHDGDARPGRSGDRRHVQPLGQGQPVRDRRRHAERVGRRVHRVPRHHQRRRRRLDHEGQHGRRQPVRERS